MVPFSPLSLSIFLTAWEQLSRRRLFWGWGMAGQAMPHCHQQGCSPTASSQVSRAGWGQWLGTASAGQKWQQCLGGRHSRAGIVAVVGDSHSLAEMVVALFLRRCCRLPGGTTLGHGQSNSLALEEIQSLLRCSKSWHRQSLSLVFPHFSLLEFLQCSFLSLLSWWISGFELKKNVHYMHMNELFTCQYYVP